MPHDYVYVLHFTTPHHHAQHYIGSTTDLEERLKRHKAGQGARLTQVLVAAGKGWELATVFQVPKGQGRQFERRAKEAHGGARYCTICGGSAFLPGATSIDPSLIAKEEQTA